MGMHDLSSWEMAGYAVGFNPLYGPAMVTNTPDLFPLSAA
jgi:hypothetical protein